MTKILGLDLGTNSIGWAVVEKNDGEFNLLDKGVRIFQEGVKTDKGVESSKAAERTGYRSARRLKFRRKLRKIETLKALSEAGFCPRLEENELKEWRYNKVYPQNENFINWWRTDEDTKKHPYYYRYLAAIKKLDLSIEQNRFIIGRAFYHMAQRRGFLSNRLEGTKESDGAVKQNIEQISAAKGDKTLGQYFYEKYLNGEKIRDQYTHREFHYLEEFNKICEVQDLPQNLKNQLHRAIFYQRPLKSQKGLIGKCVFEPKKQRCSTSHPLFEEYRMLCFVNNIKIKTPEDEKMRFLNKDERIKVIARFFLKRDHFSFDDLAKEIAPKKQMKYYKSRGINPEDYLFNYKLNTTVSGNPVSARLSDYFTDDFLDNNYQIKTQADGSMNKKVQDAWHALMTFDNEENLKDFALKKLELEEEKAISFSKITLKSDFASLSINAIKKILPYLREGMIYSHAVVLANIINIVPKEIWQDVSNQKDISDEIKSIIQTQNQEKSVIEIVNGLIKNCRDNGEVWSKEAEDSYTKTIFKGIINYFGKNSFESLPEAEKTKIVENANELFKTQMQKNLDRGEFIKVKTIDERVKDFLIERYKLDESQLGKIYHPSAIEVYKEAKRAEDGLRYLGSPLISSVKNPMAMRALHQLRKVINELINNEIIDENTKINIEMSRGLLNANERKAIQNWQRDRESLRKQYAGKISEHYKNQGYATEPSEDDILKYQLWEEQQHKCIYTGNEIALSDFLGANPKYDIEHTIPRSQSFDNSQVNKTLCESRFNREIKGNKIPFELSNHSEIKDRVELLWKNKIEELEKQIQGAVKQSKGAVDKDSKDRAIVKRHKLKYELDYIRGKYNRFFMEDVPQGFKNSQIVDIGIITKYSRLYLKTIFDKVYTVKGNTVADFRKMWGLQSLYKKKERINHIHHCIDAIVIACMTKENYEELAKFYHDSEDSYQNNASIRPEVKKPWDTFTEDVLKLENEILVSHHTPDVLPKQSRKKLKKRGRVVRDENGNPIYLQGDTVRGSLHKETFYGAIEKELPNKKGELEKQIKYVVRKPLDILEDSNIKNIVDDKVREIIENARIKEKELKKEIDYIEKKLKKAEEHEEPALKEEISRIKNEIQNLYSLPNKNGNPIPIRKVRIYTPTVTNPIHLKLHRDKSKKSPKPYKEHYHVTNDGNYMMAIYEGVDEKGNIKRDFEIRTNLEAAEYFKLSVQKSLKAQGIKAYEGLVPLTKTAGKLELSLKAILKIGTMVILWEKSPEEVWELDLVDLKKRIYKIVGLSNQKIRGTNDKTYEFATIVMRFHQEASQASDLKTLDGVFNKEEEYKAQRKLNHNQFNALVEGYDFKLSTLGEIIKIEK
jgi:CRISPR-associated endonuclease Csn1